jgi:hypothetical protein
MSLRKALCRGLDARPAGAGDAIRLRLLVGQRGGEVHCLTWGGVV